MTLTPRQSAVLTFIIGEMARTGGIAPTYAEIAAACTISGRGAVAYTIAGLVARGYLQKPHGQHRCYVVLKDASGTPRGMPDFAQPPKGRAALIARIAQIEAILDQASMAMAIHIDALDAEYQIDDREPCPDAEPDPVEPDACPARSDFLVKEYA